MTLTSEQLSRAQTSNVYFYYRLYSKGLRPTDTELLDAGIDIKQAIEDSNHFSMPPWGTPHFATSVAYFQSTHKLTEDGVLGPLTAAKILHPDYRPSYCLMLNGRYVDFPKPVIGFWDIHGLSWDHLDVTAKLSQPRSIDLGVLHWDECRSSRECYQVLVHRQLSVEFAIDDDGTIFQFCDPSFNICRHAGVVGYHVNTRAWGVEINCPGTSARPHGLLGVTNTPSDAFNNVPGFTPAQIESVIALTKKVNGFYGIPLVLPGQDGTVSTQVDTRCLDTFRGACGHYHIINQKEDPGLTLWPPMLAEGFTVG